GVVNRRCVLYYSPFDKAKRESLKQPSPILHAPAIQHAERPDDVGNPVLGRQPGSRIARIRKQGVDVNDVVVPDVLGKPFPQWKRDLVEPGLPSKIRNVDTLLIYPTFVGSFSCSHIDLKPRQIESSGNQRHGEAGPTVPGR